MLGEMVAGSPHAVLGALLVGRQAPRQEGGGLGVVPGPCPTIDVGDDGALRGIRHHHEMPALGVAGGRSLHRDLDALLDHVLRDRA